MPVLNARFAVESQAPDGRTVTLSPQASLVQRGPCVQVSLGIAQTFAAQLAEQGIALPAPVTGYALIDTGASNTCVDEDIAQQLGLPVVDVVHIASASHALSEQNVYPLNIEFVGFPATVDAPHAIGAPLASQGLVALIGRDLLQRFTLFYNGLTGQITLSV